MVWRTLPIRQDESCQLDNRVFGYSLRTDGRYATSRRKQMAGHAIRNDSERSLEDRRNSMRPDYRMESMGRLRYRRCPDDRFLGEGCTRYCLRQRCQSDCLQETRKDTAFDWQLHRCSE